MTARLYNKYFVAIKLDQEERPDLDRIYLAAAQALPGFSELFLAVYAKWSQDPAEMARQLDKK